MTGSHTITHDHDYYEILNLPYSPSTALSKQQLKLAYHKALLQHHPDKTPSAEPPTPTQAKATPTVTIDAITAAYKTLSDPALRAEYDRLRRLDRASAVGRGPAGENAAAAAAAAAAFHTGLEVVDLEDLECEEREDGARWFRGCRCGDERGFLVTEADLEKEVEQGEVVIGCRGCSLWMKILFAVEGGQG
ncbi:diphthamide biosynthesis protein 4 [Aspergillus clavatus NRRL 1]|uniref:Diphthamide biosynthesis protein 4 n=1 Tax=Aspergillus clavatus (strain ATCC 1007 / CBS 513.65 / DSM 816 / NCTC 3887 / NRRL 1 / QM 1276 / 107) TaxID=344612 RepID=A1CHM2_ASPCL|nr:DnaJ domain protein [Aspergillus clavatus NRRL 1]EAW10377.1 DnaJ domain protein [Aspergillus clavatus NRRL 1]